MRRSAASIGHLAALAMPAGTASVFDGLPFDTLPEFAALGLVAVAMATPGQARSHDWRGARGAVVLLVVVVTGKLLLLGFGASGGFGGCYRALTGEPPTSCARSWANPFRLGDVTRVDPVLAFASVHDDGLPPAGLSDSTWNLSLFNDNRFNFYPWEPGVRVRERLPFQATWEAWVTGPRQARVTAVGEVALALDGRWTRPPAAYAGPLVHRLTIPSGLHRLRIEFRFDDGSVQPWSGSAPYAMLVVHDDDGLLAGGGVAAPLRALGVLVDLLLAGSVAAVTLPALRRLRPFAAPLALALGIAVIARWLPALALAPPLLLVAGLRRAAPDGRPPPGAVLLGAAGLAALLRPLALVGSLPTVVLRSAGDDWLTYESHARALLDHASLWGGEDVFVYSAGFRYVVGAVRLLLGDGDLLPFVLGHTLLLWAALLLAIRFTPSWPRGSPWLDRLQALAAIAAVVVLFDMLGGAMVVHAVMLPLSEWPTWVALPLVLVLLFGRLGPRAELAGCALLGITAVVRAEQIPALVFLLALWLWWRRRAGYPMARLVSGLLAACAIGLLPAAHNVAYGGRLAVLPETPRLPVNFPLSPTDLLRLPDDPQVRAVAASQMAGMLYLMPHSDELARPEPMRHFRAAQALWLLAAGLVAARRLRRRRWQSLDALLLLPAAYLLPHLFVQVYVYYPRHVVAGHLAMVVTALVVLGRLAPHPAAAAGSDHGTTVAEGARADPVVAP